MNRAVSVSIVGLIAELSARPGRTEGNVARLSLLHLIGGSKNEIAGQMPETHTAVLDDRNPDITARYLALKLEELAAVVSSFFKERSGRGSDAADF